MNIDKLIKDFSNIESEFIDEALDYHTGSKKGDIIMSIKKIAVIAACAVLVIGATVAVGQSFKSKEIPINKETPIDNEADIDIENPIDNDTDIDKENPTDKETDIDNNKDMTNSVLFQLLSPKEGDIEILDPATLPFGEKDVILTAYGEFDILDSDGNFIVHVDSLTLDAFPYKPGVIHCLGVEEDTDIPERYIPANVRTTRFYVMRCQQEDGSWLEEVGICFSRVYFDSQNEELCVLNYDKMFLESGTYSIHIDSFDIAYLKGETPVELSGDWTTIYEVPF